MILIMKRWNFLCWKKTKLKRKTTFASMFYCHEYKLTFPIYISDQKFEKLMDFLLIFDGDKSQYVYIKYF